MHLRIENNIGAKLDFIVRNIIRYIKRKRSVPMLRIIEPIEKEKICVGLNIIKTTNDKKNKT